MSNLGLERFLTGKGLGLVRAAVGDRYVVETMRAQGYNIGGEQSGHIIMSDHATTGDGLVAALQILAELVESGERSSTLLHQFDPLPQLLKNVRFGGGQPLEDVTVKKAIADAEGKLTGKGRLLIRKSGTEPLIRVMAEGEDPKLVETLVDQICEAVKAVA
jgi:phosphoglucosamine mutase